MTKEIHSVLIQGGKTPGIRMEVQIPASAPQYAEQIAKAQYPFSGAEYIWQGSNNCNRDKYSSSSSGGSSLSESTGSGGGHSHSISGSISGSGTLSMSGEGGGQAHENRPPYYALCYIMKT